jgi:hypothetical protein
MSFPLPFGRRRSLLGHPVPARDFRSPHGRPTRQRLDPGGVSTFRTSESRPDWAPSLPRGPAVLTQPVRSLRPPLAPSPRGQALSPRHAFHLRSCLLRGVIKGSLAFARPAFPLTCWPRMGQEPLGLALRASHPGRQDLRGARRSGGRASSTRPELYARHHRTGPPSASSLKDVRPRVARSAWT